jgi:hypothetical protein
MSVMMVSGYIRHFQSNSSFRFSVTPLVVAVLAKIIPDVQIPARTFFTTSTTIRKSVKMVSGPIRHAQSNDNLHFFIVPLIIHRG